ncbi:hypothetical protein FOTG_14971 [Fusarium oxysporum f. sp. vasinfectum 25433]|uniref:Uncharacterized protein n=1 Tax=Fusarium oxysporum f. sp. vasinfectum 25433 TaxID=1089449 RepID=X0KSY0_FUSOX|nr:hypothetical protein FOTG_14971 [Fusarium oxysporum f. sp. vasinfectum 25433]
MASFDYDTMSASYWGKIVAIGLVWTPSAYFSNSWVNNQPPGTFMSIAWVIFQSSASWPVHNSSLSGFLFFYRHSLPSRCCTG